MTRRFTRSLRRNSIALLALFFALSGTTFAAANALVPNNSVGAKQLKKNAVTTPKIKKNAVTGAKVKNDSLTGADVLESSLAKVPSATAADSATSATNATNATTASNLNGYAANGLVRVAQVHAASAVLGASVATVATVSITAPAAGFVKLEADYSMSGTGCACEAWMLLRDNVAGTLSPNYRITRTESGGLSEGSFGWIFPVAAGVRTFDLRGFRGAGTTATLDTPTIDAMYVPFGSTGASTLAQPLSQADGSPTSTK
jgi:hypothetical protein